MIVRSKTKISKIKKQDAIKPNISFLVSRIKLRDRFTKDRVHFFHI